MSTSTNPSDGRRDANLKLAATANNQASVEAPWLQSTARQETIMKAGVPAVVIKTELEKGG